MLNIFAFLLGIVLLVSIASVKTYGEVRPPLPKRDFRVRLIQAVLLAEAGGEGPTGIECVAEVIKNRMASRKFDANAVVTQPRQFSCLNNFTNLDKFVESVEARAFPADVHQRALRCALALVFTEHYGKVYLVLDKNYTRGATHYFAPDRVPTPFWARDVKPTLVWGHHRFYKIDR